MKIINKCLVKTNEVTSMDYFEAPLNKIGHTRKKISKELDTSNIYIYKRSIFVLLILSILVFLQCFKILGLQIRYFVHMRTLLYLMAL